jgi:hypothetical protein
MNYYCLIAGLPDIEIEDNKVTFSVADFKEEVRPQLSADDVRLFDLFFAKFDNQNLLRYLKDKEAQFEECGNITKEELEEALTLYEENADPKNKNIPPYFKIFVEEYNDAVDVEVEKTKWENRLTELYYQWAMKCDNKLISSWFEFNLNLNNTLSVCSSRKYELDVQVVGDNEIAKALKTSNLRDFGLTGTIEDFESFLRLADETDLFEREKKIDLMKWQWLDEQTFFTYFSIERVFAYLVKLEIIERWVGLDPVEGGKIFRELIDGLKDTVVKEV